MVRHARTLVVGALAACIAVALAAPPVGAAHDNAVQFIRGQGSDATYDVMQKLDFAYNNSLGCQTASSTEKPLNSTCTPTQPLLNGQPIPRTENYSHDIALSYNPIGSSNGISMLNQFGSPNITRIDFARSSRARDSSKDNAALRFVAFARDGLTWGNFRTGTGDSPSPAANVDNLTVAQMQEIWGGSCTINSWNDIVGTAPDVPIYVWGIQNSSGTGTAFNTFLGISDNSTCIPSPLKDTDLTTNGNRVIFENDPTPIRDCATYASPTGSCPDVTVGTTTYTGHTLSIYPMSYGAYFVWPTPGGAEKAAGLDLGRIGGQPVANADGTLNTATFPSLRNIYNVYRSSYTTGGNAPASAYDYVSEEGWICKVTKDNGSGTQVAAHTTNPRTGQNYADEIANLIITTGMGVLLTTPKTINGVAMTTRCITE